MALTVANWYDTVYHVADYLYKQYIEITQQDENNPVPTVQYQIPRCLYYDSYCKIQVDYDGSYDMGLVYPCHVSMDDSSQIVVDISGFSHIDSVQNSSRALQREQTYGEVKLFTGSPISTLSSFIGAPLFFNSSGGYFVKYFYDNSSSTTRFTECNYTTKYANGRVNDTASQHGINQQVYYPRISSYSITNGQYDFTTIAYYPNMSQCELPCIYTQNGGFMNVNALHLGDQINNYYENTLNYTKNVYNYTTNEGDNVTINFYPEGGFIDLSPLNGLTLDFDDIIGIFNGIVPVVNLDNDFDPDIQFPSWTDLIPSGGGGGDVNVNIDLPDVTGVYPPVTVKPIVSEMNDLLPNGLPPAPAISLSPENATSAVQAGFTFFDGLGLLVPFITVAFIRLLISKFRGDS